MAEVVWEKGGPALFGEKAPAIVRLGTGERGGRGSGSIAPQELRACAPITIVPPDQTPSVTRGIRWRGRATAIAKLPRFGSLGEYSLSDAIDPVGRSAGVERLIRSQDFP